MNNLELARERIRVLTTQEATLTEIYGSDLLTALLLVKEDKDLIKNEENNVDSHILRR